MALFKRSQKKTEAAEEKKEVKKAPAPEEKAVKPVSPGRGKAPAKTPAGTSARIPDDLSRILLRPRITEKATIANEKRAYVFEVDPRATKKTVKEAVQKFYKVTPVKVNIVKIPAKKRVSQMRRVRGMKSGGKKAYVYLKAGDSISFI